MKIITDLSQINIEKSKVAIGTFNGLHLGHMKLLNSICEKSSNLCDVSQMVVFRFEKPSNEVLHSRIEKGKLLDEGEENEIFESMGVDYLIRCPIENSLIGMSPEEFISDILVKKLHIEKIVCGTDFRFGKNRSGDVETLKEAGTVHGFQVVVIEDVVIDDIKVSTTSIKNELEKGDISQVNKLLGRPYSISGTVIEGRKIGRTIDFPTINIAPEEYRALPPFGVYYTKVILDGDTFSGITNIGTNPTVSTGDSISVETHILNQKNDYYGKKAKILFYRFVRRERKFDSLEDLKKQIGEDISGFSL